MVRSHVMSSTSSLVQKFLGDQNIKLVNEIQLTTERHNQNITCLIRWFEDMNEVPNDSQLADTCQDMILIIANIKRRTYKSVVISFGAAMVFITSS